MKISIIIPSFNRENLISETLDSVLAQSYQNWECLVVDDGSTDGSVKIVKRFAQKDKRFKFFQRNRNPKGAPTCRNIGIENAEGEYVVFLDSDDLMAPWCLEERNKEVTKNQVGDMYLFPTISFNSNASENKYQIIFPKEGDDLLMNLLTFKGLFQTSSSTWSLPFLKTLLFDENLPCWQDSELHIRALLASENIKVFHTLPDIFIRKENNSGNRISNTLSSDFAAILHNYAYPKNKEALGVERFEILRQSVKRNISTVIERAPNSLMICFAKVIKQSKTLNFLDKVKVLSYLGLYFAFRLANLPNIPFRLRALINDRGELKIDEVSLSKADLSKIYSKLKMNNSPLIDLIDLHALT